MFQWKHKKQPAKSRSLSSSQRAVHHADPHHRVPEALCVDRVVLVLDEHIPSVKKLLTTLQIYYTNNKKNSRATCLTTSHVQHHDASPRAVDARDRIDLRQRLSRRQRRADGVADANVGRRELRCAS